MAIKDMLMANTADILETTELLKVLGDREGQFVWKQLTAEGGDFVAFVTADDENSYPNGGELDGYWYELVEEGLDMSQFFNFSKIAIDEITPTVSGAVTVPHSLGIVPKVIIVIAQKTIQAPYYPIRAACVVMPSGSGSYPYWVFTYYGSSSWVQNYGPSSGGVTSTSFRFGTSADSMKMQAGVTYKVITMG